MFFIQRLQNTGLDANAQRTTLRYEKRKVTTLSMDWNDSLVSALIYPPFSNSFCYWLLILSSILDLKGKPSKAGYRRALFKMIEYVYEWINSLALQYPETDRSKNRGNEECKKWEKRIICKRKSTNKKKQAFTDNTICWKMTRNIQVQLCIT